jgi:dUTP pyrophosphatase
MQVKFKKLNKKAVIPTKAHPTDAGFDMVAVTKTVTDKYVEYDTGIATAIPEGHVGLIFANSRVSKYDLDLANAVGIIDSHYRSSIRFRYKYTTQPSKGILTNKTKYFGLVKNVEFIEIPFHPKEFNIGDVVGQLIIIPIPDVEFVEVDELDETDRGEGGFGSTEKPVEPVVEPVVEAPQPSKKKRGRKPKKK